MSHLYIMLCVHMYKILKSFWTTEVRYHRVVKVNGEDCLLEIVDASGFDADMRAKVRMTRHYMSPRNITIYTLYI